MENEILAAEIFLHPVDIENATEEIDAELNKVEQALKSYPVSVSMLDYSIAVVSGILAGAIDALFVKETMLPQNRSQPVSEQLRSIVKKVLFENAAQDKVSKPVLHSAVRKGIPAMIPELEAVAKQPTPIGLAAAVLVQAGRGGLLNEKNNEFHLMPDDVSKADGALIMTVAVFAGIMRWLATISEEGKDQNQPASHLKNLDKLCELIRSAPAFSKVVDEIERWQRQLPNEIKCSKNRNSENASLEKTFYSFFSMMATIPVFANTNLQKTVGLVQEGKRIGLDEIPILKCASKQAFPVLINEVIVRSCFFISRLVRELIEVEDISSINWGNILPFGNRSIDRLLTISSITLSVADTADAAFHSAIDSCGNEVLFATKFVTRFNYVAAGRAAIAVVKEISYERQQAQLIHIKRILAEAKTAKALEVLQNYQEQLENRVSEYLADDITVFLEGFATMDQGLSARDSDLVIKGNVMIQRVLGREPQFTNQKEFDNLMDSDISLIL